MTAGYPRQVAAECDAAVTRLCSGTALDDVQPVLAEAMAALARAAAVLHLLGEPDRLELGNGDMLVADGALTRSQYQRLNEEFQLAKLAASNQDVTSRGIIATERAARLRAERERDEARRQAREVIGTRTCSDDFRKLWHQAANQRDILIRAARELDLQKGSGLTGLRLAVERVEAGGGSRTVDGAKLRRELWHVLDREPGTDEDLIATVRNLVKDLASCGPHPIEIESLRRERDQLRQAAAWIERDRIDEMVADTATSPERRGRSSVAPELLDRLAELADGRS